ncbi:MAG: hypothetical protein AMS16_04005 [Planctomycetes bacterium DG_58]|nr:MAG: hypothetical protein AMS16_04005 [Planctomycetes bacterium DG_58]KPL00391.1 MAG: hypothetical protein AMK75_05420 [Planctomycetes bacterium SM23_65]
MAAKISKLVALPVAVVSAALLMKFTTGRPRSLVILLAFAVAMLWFPDWFERTIPSSVDPQAVRRTTIATAWAILLVILAIAIGVSL